MFCYHGDCITTAHLTATLWSGMFSWCLTVKRDLVLKSIEILLESGWCNMWCSDDRRIISYPNYLFETFPFSKCYWSDRFSIRSIFSRKSRISSLSSGSVTSIQTWKTRTSSRTGVTLNIQTHAHSPTFDLNTSWPIRAAERWKRRDFLPGFRPNLENLERQHFPEIKNRFEFELKFCFRRGSVRAVIGHQWHRNVGHLVSRS